MKQLHAERSSIQGAVGPLEVELDEPAGDLEPVGVAVVCHPHPQHGGTMHNKVVITLSRAFVLAGWRVLRFNFRGVGASAGQWDEGRGEIDDALAVLRSAHQVGAPLALAGFSFGAYVASHAYARRAEVATQAASSPAPLVLVGPATSRFKLSDVPPDTLVVHGEADEVVPLAATFDWARPMGLPVTVLPGVGHFFHGQLPRLRALVLRHLLTPAEAR